MRERTENKSHEYLNVIYLYIFLSLWIQYFTVKLLITYKKKYNISINDK